MQYSNDNFFYSWENQVATKVVNKIYLYQNYTLKDIEMYSS